GGLDEKLRRGPGADRERPVLAAEPHGVGGWLARFDFDGLSGLEVVLFDESEERRILIRDPRDAKRRHRRTRERAGELRVSDGAGGTRDWIAVRIVRRVAEHLVDEFDQSLRHDMLQLLGIVVHLVPLHSHHLDEEQLDEAMATQDETGEALA